MCFNYPENPSQVSNNLRACCEFKLPHIFGASVGRLSLSNVVGFFQDLICLYETCEWARISELRTDKVEDLVEGGEAAVEESSGFVPADSPPYRATSPIFFPVRSQDPGLSSP